MAQPPRRQPSQRAMRRQRLRERQFVVYGTLVAAMLVMAVIAVAVLNNVISAPLTQDFKTPSQPVDPVYAEPCLPADTMPVGRRQVEIEVLNASDRAGLAGITATTLEDRGFTVTATGNSDQSLQGTRIAFGAAGIAAAHTLGAYLEDVSYYYDDREDATVSLSLGQQSTGTVLAADEVNLQPDVPLESSAGCVALELLTPQPQYHEAASASATPSADPAASAASEEPAGDAGQETATEGE